VAVEKYEKKSGANSAIGCTLRVASYKSVKNHALSILQQTPEIILCTLFLSSFPNWTFSTHSL